MSGGQAKAAHLLIVDNDIDLHHRLHLQLSRHGFKLSSAYCASDAWPLLGQAGKFEHPVDLVIADLNIPDSDGFRFLQSMTESFPDLPVVLMSAQGSSQEAARALSAGARHFILKPLRVDYLLGVIERTLGLSHTPSTLKPMFCDLVGESPCMQTVFQTIRKVAPTTASVLILGECGSGKELVAQAIHRLSPRAQAPFIAVNCASLPSELLEAELFGASKNPGVAFDHSRGLFTEAGGGSIFLDEVGDLPLSLQAKLLRLIQTREVCAQSREANVRIIAATHRNLREAIRSGQFREDLYFRLNVVQISVPPLRERPGDIPLLAQHFLNRFNQQSGSSKQFTDPALASLIRMPWVGNVRELENTIQRGVVLSENPFIDEADLAIPSEQYGSRFTSQSDQMTLEEVERQYIAHVLQMTGGVKEKATKILGIDRKTLYRKERKYGLQQLSISNVR